MIKAVIFDLDGTVGNTLPLCIAAFRKAIEPLSGKQLSDQDIIDTFGPSEEGTIMALAPDHYDCALKAYLAHYEAMHDMCPAPFDGIGEILRMLRNRGITVAMVTGKGPLSCTITLNKYGLSGLFDMVETGSPLGPMKPEGIQKVLDCYGLSPGEAVYVGDTPSDIISSRRVGIPVIAAAWAATSDADGLRAMSPDHLFSSTGELRTFLEGITDK